MSSARPILAGLATVSRLFGTYLPVTLLSVALLSACATLPPSGEPAGIGPYQAVSARLLVIEPTRRWQVMLDWQADSPDSGHARLTHAATGTVVELVWQHHDIRLRDSKNPIWRKVTTAQLAAQGVVISPYDLSRFLTGRVPKGYTSTGDNDWEHRDKARLIRVHWDDDARRLVLTDIRHGRKATLLLRNTVPVSALLDGSPPGD